MFGRTSVQNEQDEATLSTSWPAATD